jgi:hypothetical protein
VRRYISLSSLQGEARRSPNCRKSFTMGKGKFTLNNYRDRHSNGQTTEMAAIDPVGSKLVFELEEGARCSICAALPTSILGPEGAVDHFDQGETCDRVVIAATPIRARIYPRLRGLTGKIKSRLGIWKASNAHPARATDDMEHFVIKIG